MFKVLFEQDGRWVALAATYETREAADVLATAVGRVRKTKVVDEKDVPPGTARHSDCFAIT